MAGSGLNLADSRLSSLCILSTALSLSKIPLEKCGNSRDPISMKSGLLEICPLYQSRYDPAVKTSLFTWFS